MESRSSHAVSRSSPLFGCYLQEEILDDATGSSIAQRLRLCFHRFSRSMFDEFVRDIVLLQSAKKIILCEHRLDSTETSSILPLIVNVCWECGAA